MNWILCLILPDRRGPAWSCPINCKSGNNLCRLIFNLPKVFRSIKQLTYNLVLLYCQTITRLAELYDKEVDEK